MELLNVFKEYNHKKLEGFPKIVYSNLYEKVFNNFYFEFNINRENYLYSPLYVQLMGDSLPELSFFIDDINSFTSLIEQALDDGIIDTSEKEQLMYEGSNVAQLSYEMASPSARARTYLIMVQDYIDHLNRRLIKNWH